MRFSIAAGGRPRGLGARHAARRRIAATLWCLGSLAAADARGETGVDQIVATALPYWRVGDIDRPLSRLCALGQFNQRTPYRFGARFVGAKGSALLGAAKGTGLNLADPSRQADPGRDYWFYRDRTSDCMVFAAKVKPASGGGP